MSIVDDKRKAGPILGEKTRYEGPHADDRKGRKT
jgi:hypothetical protein